MATYLSTRTTPPPHIAPSSVRDEELDLRTLMSTLGDHKRMILFGTLAFFLLSVLYVVLATPKYEANATVQVERRMPTFPGLNANAAQQSSPAESPATTEIQLLTSRTVLSEALDNLDLDVQVQPARFPLFGSYIARHFTPSHPNAVNEPWFGMARYGWGGESVQVARLDVPQELIDQPLRLVAGDANTYTLYDPEGRALVRGTVGKPVQAGGVNMLVRSLNANPGMRFEVTRLNSLAILDKLRHDISASEQGRDSGVIALSYENEDPVLARQVLEQVSRAYVHQNVARNSAEAAKRLQFVKRQLPNVRKELDKAQAALTAFQSRTQTLDVGVQNQSLLNQTVQIDSAISQLRIQQADLAARFTPAHPMYKAVLSQIAQFQAQKGQLQGRIAALPETQQGLFRLTRDVEVTNQTYASLLDQAQQLDIARASAVGNARVIDPAAVNYDSPAWPKPLPVVFGGTLLGALLMFGFVLFRQMMRRGVEDPADIELLGLPVYASIPYSERGREITMHPSRFPNGSQRLLALNAPTDLAMEALRSLRTSLHFARFKTKNNLLMISAPSPGVGKTFVCANLAVTMAQAGQTVLLIDADMRRGTLHHAVGVRSEGGLSELITGQIPLEEAIRKVAGADNLSFISRGEIPPNPSELLMNPAFNELLEQVGPRFDIVIIDTPPVLAVTDAAVIGHQVGTCLMVVRFGLNQQREIALAKQRLEQNGVEVKGAIFNGVQKRSGGHYAYTYYEYLPQTTSNKHQAYR
ncbi:tyrosine protein kinase [Lysobacter helvus]|uniref:Tyrosine protein kinase n=2 Tax=Lysobacteraceae TaxID=32033 RepID=A0ABM7Q7D9_9GAMM|nr:MULTISPECIES: polysaccharide biosynthesis tyrosine autokinase [Lysobacter]BCT93318.1 tyrosine protein kinase [Lysobacter caseinilyticus]BCT96471.1 tyrosine protein kinase [Lysobacter helvus]